MKNILNVSLDELLGKETIKTKIIPEEERKDINSMILKINIDGSDGDTVYITVE